MGRIRIGVSGWDYPHWRSDFYPKGLPRTNELGYAAKVFGSIEINGTFYSLKSPATFRSWYEAAPTGFRYAVNGSRFITHNKKLGHVDGALANFLASGLLELKEKLGPILWQVPGNLRFDAERVEGFLSLLPRDTVALGTLAERHDGRIPNASLTPDRNRRVRHVLEPRHPSWLVPELSGIARRHGVALAFSHAADWPYTEEVTAGFVYIRLHGPDRLYDSAYGEEGLAAWADRLKAWRRGGEPRDAVRITDHPPPRRRSRDVYVYFDNDGHGHAPREARRLAELLAVA